MPKSLLLIVLLLACTHMYPQNVAINNDGSPPNASAILDITSTSKGILIPRMPKAQRDAISSPATGLMIYQTDNSPGLYMYSGTGWTSLTMVSQVWGISGNAGTNPATDFLGTADNNPLRLRLNNKWAGELNHISNNSCIGDSSGIMMTTGFANTSFGNKSLKKNTSGKQNVAFGYRTLMNNLGGELNTAIGHNAQQTNASGSENTAVGSGALMSNVNGNYNTGVGAAALLSSNATGNTAIGAYALYNVQVPENTAVGLRALQINTFGSYNTAVGSYSLYQNTIGNYCTAVGHSALYTSTGDHNTAMGTYALNSNTTGHNNTAIGSYAMRFGQTAYSNTALGKESLYNASTCIYNTTVGERSAYNTTSGGGNVALGFWSLYNNSTGAQNTAVGTEALAYNYTGTYNVSMGGFSGTSTSFDNTTSLNNHGYANGGNNQAFLGNLSTIWNGGNVGWSTFSDARVKKDIRDDVKGLDFITRLHPVTYTRDIDRQAQLTGNLPVADYPSKYDIEQIRFSGFLAQEVEQAAQASGYDFSGLTRPQHEHQLYTLSYESFVVPLVKAIQEQQTIIDELKTRLAAVEQYIEDHRQ